MNQAIDYTAILPELILAGTIILVLVVDAFLSPAHKWMAMPLAFAGVVASLIATLTLIGDDRSTFGGAFVVDEFALLFKVFFLSVACSCSWSPSATSARDASTRASSTSWSSPRSSVAC
jgi:NADH:ubiquinone oxidoreductase subunit 2 (subunit N)